MDMVSRKSSAPEPIIPKSFTIEESKWQQDDPFMDEYKTIFSYEYNAIDVANNKKQFIGNTKGTCRFCGESKPKVTFLHESHIIPAAFDNRTLFSTIECDTCNGMPGSVYENDLVNMFSVDRVMSRIRSRKGHVKLHRKDQKTQIISDAVNNTVAFEKHDGESELFDIQEINSDTIAVSVDVPSHKPINACKALARMSMFVIDDSEILKYNHIIEWLRNDQFYKSVIHHIFVPGAGMKNVTFKLFKTENNMLPPLVVLFAFGTTMLFYHVPDHTMEVSRYLLPVFPRSPYAPYDLTGKKITINSDNKILASKVNLTIKHGVTSS